MHRNSEITEIFEITCVKLMEQGGSEGESSFDEMYYLSQKTLQKKLIFLILIILKSNIQYMHEGELYIKKTFKIDYF